MTKLNKLGKVATAYSKTEDGLTVIYHQTTVVKVDHHGITLNTGGWKTVTTKVRMNQASNQFNLGYSVFQHKGEWYVTWKGQIFPFFDNDIILPK